MPDYVLVPKEPTKAMVAAGQDARWQSPVRDANNVREIYRAMLSAAPPPETVGLETDIADRKALAELRDGDTLRIADEGTLAALLRDIDTLLSQADAARRTMDISTQANLQTAAEILDLLSSRLGDAEYAAPGGMVYVGYVEATQLTRAQAQAKVLRNIVANSAHLPRSTEGGT